MVIPIICDGRQVGTVRSEDGRLRADMEDVGRVVRLYVFGERTYYIGIPEPAEGRLRLEKRFTAADRRDFPEKPKYAGEKSDEKTEKPPEKPGRRVLWQGGRPHYF